jgi:hypothetical protein
MILADGGRFADAVTLEIPELFSLQDLVTWQGILQVDPINGKSFYLTTFSYRERENILAWAKLTQTGSFLIQRPDKEGGKKLARLQATNPEERKLLVQMRCDKRETTCRVTSLGNPKVVSFNYAQAEIPALLLSDVMGVGQRVPEVINLTSVTFCKAKEPSVKLELRAADFETEGTYYELVCRVRGLPVLTATISIKDETLTDTETELEDLLEEHTLTLTHAITARSSQGTYVCKGRSLLVSEEGVTDEVNVTAKLLESIASSSCDSKSILGQRNCESK